jgi:site-specific DNA recombinase
MRIIAAVRLSRMVEETTSIESQTESMRDYARRNGHVIVAETQDLDVSGGKPIRQRPGIGYWLTPERLGDWDAIAGYSIDRMFRNLYDFITFYHDFLLPNSKSIIITSENIDMTSPDGRTMAQMRVVMAENELNKITERRQRGYRVLYQGGYWPGGQIPFGYMSVKDGKHYRLILHPEHAAIVRRIADEIINGKPLGQVARELTAAKIPTGRYRHTGKHDDDGKPIRVPRTDWTRKALAKILRNPTLTGHITYGYVRSSDGTETYKLVRDDDGVPIRREPILDDETFAALQKALIRPPRGPGHRWDASPLLRVAHCAECDAVLYSNRFKSRGTQYAYYICSKQCGAGAVPMDTLDKAVNDSMIEAYGWVPYRNRIVHVGSERDRRLADVGQAIANLTTDRYVRGIIPNDYDDVLARLQAEHAKLSVMEPEPPKVDWEDTGLTIEQVWPTWDAMRKRHFLLDRRVKVIASRGDDMPLVGMEGGGYWETVAALGGFPSGQEAQEHFLTLPACEALADTIAKAESLGMSHTTAAMRKQLAALDSE